MSFLTRVPPPTPLPPALYSIESCDNKCIVGVSIAVVFAIVGIEALIGFFLHIIFPPGPKTDSRKKKRGGAAAEAAGTEAAASTEPQVVAQK